MTDEDVQTEAAEATLVQVTNLPPGDDGSLALLVMLINKMGSPSNAGITLFLGAGVLSGLLISWDEWRDAWISQIEGANEEIGKAFREGFEDAHQAKESSGEDGPPHPVNFIHLRDATLFSGGHDRRVPLWRGRLSEIDGWMMGVYADD